MPTAETARLIASLELQDRNFTRGLSRVEKGIGRVDSKLGAFSGALNRNMGRLVDTALSRGVDALSGTITAASDLNEEVTKSQAVFGKASAEVLAFSETTAEALGISQKEALAAAGNFGNMFKTIGLNDKTSAKFSQRLVTLAADMASFNNEDPAEMLDKLRSGLAGEAEPLRRFGVLLSESAVKEEAYASGIAKRGDKLTEAQKVQARYNLILKQTAVQQGDVAKTGGNLAGQQRKLNAMLADVSATIGKELLPVVTDLTAAFVDLLKDPGTQAGIKAFAKDLGAGARTLVDALKKVDWNGFKNALGTAAGFAKDLVTAFLGMPSWVQAAVISGWGLNKLTGGLIGDLASGLIKGVLGINAGVVNVNGPVAGMGGAGAGGAGAAGGLKGALSKGVRVFGTVGLVAANLLLWQKVVDEFSSLQTFLKTGQRTIDERIAEIAPALTGKEATANLKAVVSGVLGQNPLQQILTPLVAGGQLTADFEVAANALRKDQTLSRTEIVAALEAIKQAQDLARDAGLKTPGLDKALTELTARLAKLPAADPKDRTTATRRQLEANQLRAGRTTAAREGSTAGQTAIKDAAAKTQAAANALKNAASIASREASRQDTAQRTELTNVKNGIATLDTSIKTSIGGIKTSVDALPPLFNAGVKLDASQVIDLRKSSDQKVELGLIKNATTTLDETTRAAAVAQLASAAVQGSLQAARDAMQRVTTSTSATRVATATRQVAPPIVATLLAGFAGLNATIWAARPQIQSTTVVNSYTTSQRGGATTGSRNSGGYTRINGAG